MTSRLLLLVFARLALAVLALAPCASLAQAQATRPRNIVFILADDHRYDALGVMGHPLARTPNMDALAKGGAHMRNAFVTTALCSPSRASILTGTYAHTHGVVDNFTPIPPVLPNVGQQLKTAGYQTALIGKWHIGNEDDAPQPGFDHWVSFRGQGEYLPRAGATMLNVDGKRVPQKGYITDELTDYAIEWLGKTSRDKPFFLYLSHKGVHADFVPADRHKGSLKDVPVPTPATMAPEAAVAGKFPTWVRNQRNSWHGVEYPYHSSLDVAEYYRRYMETLRAVDDSVGRVVAWLRETGQLENTLVIYMGDNGFAFGEHGLIDKRTAFDWSMRVPMIVYAPGLVAPGQQINRLVANIDIAPTMLDLAGVARPSHMQGMSMLPLLRDATTPWRDTLLYEYYWEWSFPQTPTQFALRGEKYKYVFTHGVWDADMFFDLQADPQEAHNLADDPAQQKTIAAMRAQLFETLEKTGGLTIPLYMPRLGQMRLRNPEGSKAQPFPDAFVKKP
ncbi:Arylsulfatase [Luteitalea pratensis]|uniref:Arylsulfatase n=1 Tax=Luteitalea pratensis TaxID=1855912 RepID=A0A143PUZ4_LUTPR|nr:sulfatase [Luteitalea pratensis]AMY12402.1 Arylsulfatase [Luteitalea pratensis]